MAVRTTRWASSTRRERSWQQRTASLLPITSYAAQPSLTSESDSRLYYEDGNADVDYLTPTGQHGVAFTVSRPAGAAIGFAVSPDDTRVAVAVMTNFNGDDKTPSSISHMYLTAMGGGTTITLFDGSSRSSTQPLTWPVGWDGDDLVVAQSLPDLFSGIAGEDPCSESGVLCASQMREFDPALRVFGLPLCAGDDEHLSGVPVAAGIACEVGNGYDKVVSYNWTGTRTMFSTGLAFSDEMGCLLSPDGTLVACPSVFVDPTYDPMHFPAQVFRPGGAGEPLVDPTNAQFLGWIDDNDIVVATGLYGNGLAVENLATGRQTAFSVPVPGPVQPWQFDGMIPGAL
jgi:hypothetical protein